MTSSYPRQLTGALRSASVDARTRINDVLKHLAKSCSKEFDEKDKGVWKPSDGDATVSLELRIKAWSDYWTSVRATQIIQNFESALMLQLRAPVVPSGMI